MLAVLKTHLKWSTITFFATIKSCFFSGNYKKLFSFGKFGLFWQVWEFFSSSIKNLFYFRWVKWIEQDI